MRIRTASIAICCLLGLLVNQVWSANPAKSTSSRTAREETLRSIPFHKINARVNQKLEGVLHSPSIYRRLPVQVIDCDKDLYLFLLRYPEVVVNMWELMGATKVSLKRTSAYQFSATDGLGTDCSLELIYGTRNLHILYAEGSYEGPILKRKIRGRCVLVISSGYAKDKKRNVVSHRLDVFLQIDNLGAELIAKTLQPLVGKSADHNFAETTKFFGQVSRAAERNGPGMQRLSHRLTKVDAPIRDKFSRLAMVVNTRASTRDGTPRPTFPFTPVASPSDSNLPLLPGARQTGPELRR